MSISAEVFSWPEAALYLYPAGGPSAVMAYGENVELTVTQSYLKFKNQLTGSFAARTNFVLADKNVALKIGQLYYDAETFKSFNSATAFNCDLVFSAAGGLAASSTVNLWSAVFNQWSLKSQEGNLWRQTVSLQAADCSGV